MFIRKYGLYLAWLVSCIGVLTSMYFSDIRHIEPCHLCWYQRICLFPIAIIAGMATYRGCLGIARYLLPQTVIGFFISGYQILIQEIPGWNPIDICGAGPNCSEKIYIGLGPITIPMLATFGFLVIAALLFWVWAAHRNDQKDSTLITQ